WPSRRVLGRVVYHDLVVAQIVDPIAVGVVPGGVWGNRHVAPRLAYIADTVAVRVGLARVAPRHAVIVLVDDPVVIVVVQERAPGQSVGAHRHEVVVVAAGQVVGAQAGGAGGGDAHPHGERRQGSREVPELVGATEVDALAGEGARRGATPRAASGEAVGREPGMDIRSQEHRLRGAVQVDDEINPGGAARRLRLELEVHPRTEDSGRIPGGHV